MKAAKLGIFSAILASICCVGPLLLIALGLGSLGFGALIGQYHWWFIGAAVVLLAYAWRSYLVEAARCRTESCQMVRGKTTRTALTVASIIVVLFVGLNVYTYASQHNTTPLTSRTANAALASVTIPVEGMTCFTCELAVESSLKGLPGVQNVNAKVTESATYVEYDAAQVGVTQLIEAINKTGFKATQPSGHEG